LQSMCGVRKQIHLPVRVDNILVSSCLIGKKCSYDGNHRRNRWVLEFISGIKVIDVCPEMLGGLTSPRFRSEIKDGDGKAVFTGDAIVINEKGEDVTSFFITGANEVLRIVKENGINCAILKARSPSCGKDKIYDGTFSGGLKKGDGVTAALLRLNGVTIYDEEEVEKFLRRKEVKDAQFQRLSENGVGNRED